MANIDPAPSWAPIRQLETTDRNLAGLGGVLNTQPISIAARLNLLRDNATALNNTVMGVSSRQDAADSAISSLESQVIDAPGTLSDLDHGAPISVIGDQFPDVLSIDNSRGPVLALNESIADLAQRDEYLLENTGRSVSNYDELRTYEGLFNAVFVSEPGCAGLFVYDASSSAADNGGDVIVTANGARYLRQYSGAADFRWWKPAMDGVTDDTAAWNRAVNNSRRRLFIPPGRTRVPVATLPSGLEVFGVRPHYERTSSTFIGGTLLVGNLVAAPNCKSPWVHNIGFDNPSGNAVQFTSPGFDDVLISDIVTRGNDHNILIEQNGSNPGGGEDQGGNVRIIRPECHGGPNGIAIKAPNVTVEDAMCYDVTIQAYVAVSDNINGAAVYSRAQNVMFNRCGGLGNKTMFRVYTRDTRSLTNANGVLPARNIRWLGGSLSGTSEHGGHIGDFSAQTSGGPVGTQTLLNSEGVFIDGADIVGCGFNGILMTRVAGARINNNRFTGNGVANPGTYGNRNIEYSTGSSNVSDVFIGPNNIFSAPALGKEQSIFTWPVGAGTVTLNDGSNLYKTQNTAQTFIGNVQGGKPGQTIEILLSDDFTILNFAKSRDGLRTITHSGSGKVVRAFWDSISSTWIDLGESKSQATWEVTSGFSTALIIDYSANGATGCYINVTNNIISVSAVAPPSTRVDTQTRYTLRMYTNSSKSIGTWNSVFVFPEGAPATMTADKTRFCEFFWDGARLVCTSTFEY